MKETFKLAFTLAIYAAAACVALAFVYYLTEPRIKDTAQKETQEALLEIYPEADSFEELEKNICDEEPNICIGGVYAALVDSNVIGIVIKANGPTYGRAIVMVAVDDSLEIRTVKILSLTDTPGIGTKVAEHEFLDQFINKSTNDAFKAGKTGSDADINIISGATISSRNFTELIRVASKNAQKLFLENYGVTNE